MSCDRCATIERRWEMERQDFIKARDSLLNEWSKATGCAHWMDAAELTKRLRSAAEGKLASVPDEALIAELSRRFASLREEASRRSKEASDLRWALYPDRMGQ